MGLKLLARNEDGAGCRTFARETSPPIFSERKRRQADAIPAAEAAQIILTGVANNECIIAFPEKYRQMWRQYWSAPDAFDRELRALARQRRDAFTAQEAFVFSRNCQTLGVARQSRGVTQRT
jgi:hypothetical protein